MKRLRISIEGKTYEVEVELLDEGLPASSPHTPAVGSSRTVARAMPAATAEPVPAKPIGDGTVVSPLAAVVVSIDVAVGDLVEVGQQVVTLEAMKMNTIVSAGDAVEEGQPMISIG
jgi:biotin carboxyl carrier protein